MNEVLLSEAFLKILNMSISASWLVLTVLLLRLVLKKAPKWVSVLLWGFVAIRLICPFSIESVLSLIPSAETVSPDIMMDWTPEISTGIGSVDTVINPIITQTFAPNPATSANPLQILIPVAGMAWIAGIAVMLIYTAISYILLRRKVATAVLLRNNIYQSENVDSPFVLGIIKPKIYLPFQMDGKNLEHVIAHEESHIRRKDHWWKPFGFVLLSLHWFNPLMWLGYVLLCRDIELACDEKVIKEMDNENRADYTQALVACSVNRRSIAACPLAFGEVGVKERVKSVMNYKKPAFWIIVAAVVTCVAVAVCFLTNPRDEDNLNNAEDGYYLLIGADGVESIEVSGPDSSGGAVNADGSAFKNGEKVWLEHLQGVTDLRGYSITAYGKNGKIIYALSIPVGATDSEVVNLVSGDGWLLVPSNFELKLLQVSGKTYVYENEGILGSFHITLYNDGTFTYYEGNASSYFGVGKWKQDGDLITMTDDDEAGYGLVNHFTLNGNDLVFIEQNSSNFVYVKVKTGEKFHYTGEAYKPNSVTGDLAYLGGDQMLSLNDVIILSQKGYELGWSDFDKYKYYETGSGLYIRVYPINEMFEVWIGGSDYPDLKEPPMYIYLRPSPINDVDQKIDIRDGGVTEFISRYSNGTVISGLDAAITDAVLQKHAETVPDGYLVTESHIIVDKEIVSGTPSAGQTNHVREEIAYVYYLHLLFDVSDNHPVENEGIFQEAILTFDVDASGNYTLKRFLRPQYSAEYDEDLFKRFLSANEDVAGNQEAYAEQLLNKCWTSAGAYIENRNNGAYNPPGPMNKIFDNCLSWAGWTGDASLFLGALNSDQLQTNHTQHLPVYVFKSKAELDSFITRMDEHLSFDEARDEVPAFTETAAKYDEEFFKDNSLILVYATSGSWNTRYSATGFYCDGTSFVLHVEDTTKNDFGDTAMGGWFVSVVVDNKLIDSCSQFDAYLYNPLTE
ncbi:MAG: hypothetical protein IJA45_03860 [Oscillospiraceae bacterium]|nr:hypothetical protein [Oscillospiraceae bacterium]